MENTAQHAGVPGRPVVKAMRLIVYCTAIGWIFIALLLLAWIMNVPIPSSPVQHLNLRPELHAVLEQLWSYQIEWGRWAFASKVFACVLGGSISVLSVAVASKQLEDALHFGAAAAIAGMGFVYGILQPYDEYKQFRAAIAALEGPYYAYVAAQNDDNWKNLIKGLDAARFALKETWSAPDPFQKTQDDKGKSGTETGDKARE